MSLIHSSVFLSVDFRTGKIDADHRTKIVLGNFENGLVDFEWQAFYQNRESA
jgi:hypothetical protein